jgi:hypothetical protein
LDAFARRFEVQSADLLLAKIKSSELEAYATLDKFVGRLTAEGCSEGNPDCPVDEFFPTIFPIRLPLF